MGGGRYDGLVGMMGGPATPGVGWAAGVERWRCCWPRRRRARRPIAMVPIGEAAAKRRRWPSPRACAAAGYAVDLGYSGNLGKRMKRANKLNARAAVILGDDELAKGVATLRDLDHGRSRKRFRSTSLRAGSPPS